MKDLFREEAVTQATRRLTGSVILRSSSTSRWIAAILIAVVVAATTFAVTATYARKESVDGWLIPPAGLIRQSAPRGGIVVAIHVREGQDIGIGEPIATVRLSSAIASGDSFTLLSETLQAQRAASQDRARATVETLEAERVALANQQVALTQELNEARRRVALQRERLQLARAEVERAEQIAAQGFLPGRELELRRSNAIQTDQTLSEMTAGVLALERQGNQVESRLRTIPIDIRAAQAEARSAQAGIDQQVTQAETQSTYMVVATVAGRVAGLPASLGQAMEAGGVVAIVSPGGAPLEAELFVPSRAAGFIRAGQDVRLMYQAFPYQRFGAGKGEIISVSQTVLAPSEIQIPGHQIQEPVFRVRARLSEGSVSAYGQTMPLQPGMLLNAEVILDRRTLMEWLLGVRSHGLMV